MPRAKATTSSLSEMIDSPVVSSGAESAAGTSEQENATPPKRGRGRAKLVGQKTKPTSKRLSGAKTRATAKRVTKRAPLKDATNAKKLPVVEEGEDQGIIEDPLQADEEIAAGQTSKQQPVKPKRKGRPRKAPTQPKPSSVPPVVSEDDFEYTPTLSRNAIEPSRNGAAILGSDNVIGTVEMDLDGLSEREDLDALPETLTQNARRVGRGSRQPAAIISDQMSRAGSVAGPEHGEEGLRGQLEDMTRKVQEMETRYQNLREVGVKEAEANFDQLKRSAEERNKVSGDLIANLRQELTLARANATDAKTKLDDLKETRANLQEAEAHVKELTESLTASQNEIKSLQAKLAATRATGALDPAITHGKTANHNLDGRNGASRGATAGNAGTVAAVQVAQLKENLYSDLTGLIMRGVDRQEDAHVYDCIQTGRNGALHFKLAVPTDTTASYEDVDLQYMPRLDGNRDRDLIELLPEYLREDITFAQSNAAKFYSRVVDTLTKRHVEE